MAGRRLHPSNKKKPIVVDDFKLINGIGPAIETLLHNAGILTFSQLGAYSPEEIVHIIPGLSGKRIIKEKWISQAIKLARKNDHAKSLKEKIVPSRRQQYANFTVELLRMGDARRTIVVHVESGETESWSSWDTKRLIDFFAFHMGLKSLEATSYPQEDAKHQEKTSIELLDESIPESQLTPQPLSTTNTTSTLTIISLQVVPIDSDISEHILKQGQPFMVHLTLNFKKVVMPNNIYLMFTATIFAKQLGGPQQTVGQSNGTLKATDQATISITCSGLPPGSYRLDALVKLASDRTKFDLFSFLKGDILEIY